jgi:hypothetical protein
VGEQAAGGAAGFEDAEIGEPVGSASNGFASAVGESGEGVTQKIAAGGHEFRIAGERDSGVFRETW